MAPIKNRQNGKFFIVKRSRFSQEYYVESGVTDVGTRNEACYIHWTRYRESAHGFMTLTAARKVAGVLRAEYGVSAKIVDYYGVTVE